LGYNLIYDSVNKKYINAAGFVEADLQMTARGIGFAVRRDNKGEDIFIGRDGLNGAVDGDRVLVSMRKGTGRRSEGVIAQILERRIKNIVGTVVQSKTTVFIIPDDERLGQSLEVRLTQKQKSGGGGFRSGDKVVARFDDGGSADATQQRSENYKAGRVYISEVLGADNKVGVDILSIIRQHNLYEEFPHAVVAEAKRVAVPTSEEEIKRRVDLREKNTITIDPEDAKDLDDGVHLEKLENGTFELGVHIADVAHYVTQDSELDKEAYKRGTSVYFPDRVLPMLPKQLSNDVCSLNPDGDKLALSVIMQIAPSGEVTEHKIVESVINVKRKYSYAEVQEILDAEADEMLVMAGELAKTLEKTRRARGEVVFDVPEPKIILDEKTGKIKDVIAYPHLLSHRIIESFMVLCNETVAKKYCDLGLPFVYRIHEKPDPLKVTRFVEMLKPFNVDHKINPEYATGHAYSGMLSALSKEIKPIVSSLALRSMQKAKYLEVCIGHFGLGAPYYCHFTSPIRRYPDLVIHRIIKCMINGKLNSHKMNELKEFVAQASEQSSKTELAATEAEREVDNLKRAEFMYDKIGETFSGHVSGIQEFGVFVYLPNTVEGLVKLDNMPPDKYAFNEKQMVLVGTKRTWKMGDKIDVIVAGVNIARRQVEFRAVQ
jgi:ribonuclease R